MTCVAVKAEEKTRERVEHALERQLAKIDTPEKARQVVREIGREAAGLT